MPEKEELMSGFNLGEWEVLPDEGVIRRGETEVHPEPLTWDVLMELACRDGKLISNDELNERVWGSRAMGNEPITRQIREVRKIFGDSAKQPRYLETQHRRGYRLLKPVQLHQSPASAESTTEPAAPQIPPSGPSLRRWKFVAASLALGFVAIIAYLWIISEPPPPARSIAVMPFENLSGDANDEYLVSGFKEELVVMLAGVDEVTVKNVRLKRVEDPEVLATQLGVESLLDGSLRRHGDVLKISYTISQGARGVIHSGEVEGSTGQLFDLQEKLAGMVRESLVGKSTKTLFKSRPSGNPGYQSYMRGMFALERRGDPGRLETAIELFTKAIELDPEFGPSYLALATAYALTPVYRRDVLGAAEEREMDQRALETIEAGVAADAAIADAAGAIYGYVYHKQKRWEDSEAAYLRAVNADVVDSNAFNWYSRMLASVGRLEDSLQQALAGLELDPNSALINSRVAMTYTWMNQDEKALEFYERSNELGWSGQIHLFSHALILTRFGDIEKARQVTLNGVAVAHGRTDWVEPVFAALADPAKAADGLAVLDQIPPEQPIAPQVELILRTWFGDIDGAMRVAQMLEQPGELFETDLLFLPDLKALRQHPDFVPLLDRLGITRYWRSKGCVWSNDRVSCDPV